jgi:hypothetical protein
MEGNETEEVEVSYLIIILLFSAISSVSAVLVVTSKLILI